MSAKAGVLRNTTTPVMVIAMWSCSLRFNLLNHGAEAGALRNEVSLAAMIAIRLRNVRFNLLNHAHNVRRRVVMARAPRSTHRAVRATTPRYKTPSLVTRGS